MSQQSSPGTGLQENVAGALCYVLGWVTGVIFLILEPKNKFIKFHAIQSIITFGIIFILDMIFIWVPVLNWLIWVLALVLWVWLIIQAYQGKKFMLPVIGAYADKIASGQAGTTNPPANPPSAPPGNPAN